MHEEDDAYSILSTWSCYWLDQFLTLALNTWISSKCLIFLWICLLFILLILVGVELPLCINCHSMLECYNLFSGVKLSMRSFCFILQVIRGKDQFTLALNQTNGSDSENQELSCYILLF